MAASEAHGQSTNERPPSRLRQGLIYGGIVAFIAAFAGALGTEAGQSIVECAKGSCNEPLSVTLERPSDGDQIADYPTSYAVSGTLKGTRTDGTTIWIANRSAGETLWHPMRNPCAASDDGFTCDRLFLGPEKLPAGKQSFDVQVWVADAGATQALEQHADRPEGDNSGIKAPRGTRPSQSVTVDRIASPAG